MTNEEQIETAKKQIATLERHLIHLQTDEWKHLKVGATIFVQDSSRVTKTWTERTFFAYLPESPFPFICYLENTPQGNEREEILIAYKYGRLTNDK